MTTTSESILGAPGTAAGPGRGRWIMLAVLLAGQFMALLDVTIVNVAMPTIGRTLHASGAELQLVVSGYTVSYAMLLITGARLGDLRGRRRMFLAGIALFTLSSAVCGFAPSVTVLIAARFVQGAGAAATMPQIMSVIQARFAGPDRARALSAYSAVLASGFVAGQVLGGLLVNANLFGSAWRPVFLVNVPIGLAMLFVAPRVMTRDAAAGTRRLDLAGLAIVIPAVFAIVLPLMLGHQERWPWWILACTGAGVVLAAVFVAVERRVAVRGGDPLLNLSVLRAPGLASGLVAVIILMVTYGGFLFALALQLQGGLGESALRAGLTFAPCALAFGICGFYWRRLPSRVHHLLTPVGCLAAVAFYAALGLDLASGTRGGPLLQVILVMLGASLALGFSPLVTHALLHVPVRDAADASGLFTTTLQLGQAVGWRCSAAYSFRSPRAPARTPRRAPRPARLGARAGDDALLAGPPPGPRRPRRHSPHPHHRPGPPLSARPGASSAGRALPMGGIPLDSGRLFRAYRGKVSPDRRDPTFPARAETGKWFFHRRGKGLAGK